MNHSRCNGTNQLFDFLAIAAGEVLRAVRRLSLPRRGNARGINFGGGVRLISAHAGMTWCERVEIAMDSRLCGNDKLLECAKKV